MSSDSPLVNRVAQSGLITLDLSDFYPDNAVLTFDLKDYLVQGLVLMEKPFRASLKEHDWEQYRDKTVAVHSSADAIIPQWAWMLIASYLRPVAAEMYFGDPEHAIARSMLKALESEGLEQYRDARIVVKGCGDKPLSAEVYLEVARLLQPYVQSLMYGEACSAVPVYKRPKN